MRRFAFVVVVLLCRGSAASPSAEAPTARFAIVIGNNLPDHPSRGALRYADDDAVAMHRLFLEAGVRSRLLVSLDEGSRRLYPGLTIDGAPRQAELQRVLGEVRRDLKMAAAAGSETELLFFFSGHGDVAHGEGYLRLEDHRLTRTLLHDLLAGTPAVRKHVLIDACKAYFVAFQKGPGGQRRAYLPGFVAPAAPSQLANTGFLLSTSSDRDSHEWERYQAGVFTHALRSGLRGAADTSGDGQISYAELGAFLATSGQAIANPRFRPDFVVRPPGRPADLDEAVLGWTRPVDVLLLDLPELGHVYVENARGERLADAHPAPGHLLRLRLPAERPLFLRRGDERGEYVLGQLGSLRLSRLIRRPLALARKGALQLAFEQLFTVPFGPAQVSTYRREWTRTSASQAAPLLQVSERRPSSSRQAVLWASGLCAIGAAAAGLTLSSIAIERWATASEAPHADRVSINQTIDRLNLASIVLYAVAAAAGGTFLFSKLWWREGAARVELALPRGGLGLTAATRF